MPETAASRPKLNQDVECLRCGAMNIPENHICGRCGASLPMVYDEEGKVFDRQAREIQRQRLIARRRLLSGGPLKTAWVVRLTVIILLILIVLWIAKHR